MKTYAAPGKESSLSHIFEAAFYGRTARPERSVGGRVAVCLPARRPPCLSTIHAIGLFFHFRISRGARKMADLPIPQIINSLDVDEDKAYEPPYAIRWGGQPGDHRHHHDGKNHHSSPGAQRPPLPQELRHHDLRRQRADRYLLQGRRRDYPQGKPPRGISFIFR